MHRPPISSSGTATRVFLGLAMFLFAAWLSWLGWLADTYHSPTSPDEAANRLMAQQWARTGTLRVTTGLTAPQLAVFHPRSFAIQGNTLLPGSFVGFVMLQGLALKVGSAGPIIFTLLLSLVSVWAWYRIGRRYWEWPWALAAAALLCSLPVLIAHQLLPYTQPAVYVSFLLLTGWALLRYQEHQTVGRAIVVGLVYGLALFVRPVEVLFTGPIIAVVMLAHEKKWPLFLVTVAITLLGQIPWLLAAQQAFGAALASGYTTEGISVTNASAGLPIWKALLTPAGGAWSWNWLRTARDYLLLLYPALSAMTILALAMYFRRKFVDAKKVLKIGAVGLFIVYSLAYYGSWDLYPDAPASRIGSAASYARYWIPLYVGLVAGTIVFLRRTFPSFRPAAYTIIGLAIVANLWTWWQHPAGYRSVMAADRTAQQLLTTIISRTEPNSLVIAGHNEKLLVGTRLTSFAYPAKDQDWALVTEIVAERPVYILGIDAPMSAKALTMNAQRHELELVEIAGRASGPIWKVRIAQSL